MKTTYKFFIVGLIAIFVLSSLPPTIAQPPEGKIENREGSVFIETPDIKVKLLAGKPDIFFWSTQMNQKRRQTALFHVGFYYLAELFGDDLVIDNRQELGGKIYNLASSAVEWTLEIEEDTGDPNHIMATQTSSALADGATITFVYHIYLEDTIITETLDDETVTYEAKALSEIKFDIIVNNWVFSPEATGLALHVKIHEMQYRHRVRKGERVNAPEEGYKINETESDRTNRSTEPGRYGVEFLDGDDRRAYFAWTPEADVFDENGTYIETVQCTASSASYGFDNDFGKGKEFAKEFINLFLVYPNYGDENKLVHDPVIGIDDASGVNSSWFALFALPIIAFVVLVRKRKRA
ncbi:MAG: hypothetical protein HGN29_15980 [Asgard group archaeon]|nr:hypothetical protein [Asgard group archaeon]